MSQQPHEEIKRKLSYSRRDRLELFRRIPVQEQGPALLNLSPRVQRYLMQRITDQELLDILNYLDPQQSARLLRRVEVKRAEKILEKLNVNARDKVEYLLRFNPRAAAGLMNLNYVVIPENSRFGDVSKILEREEHATGKFPTILVVDAGHLLGELPGYELIRARPSQHVLPKVKKISTLSYSSPENKVVQAFLRHPHDKIAVVDDNHAVLGVINTDDIIPLIQERSPGGLYKFAGVTREEDAYDGALTKVKYRYKWLIINLGTAFLAASVVSLFEDTLAKFVLLAIYMPIVAGMGGNAGTQTLAVAIRGLTLREIDLRTGWRFVANEMVAGAINGVINGILVGLVAVFFNQSPMLGLVLAVAMVVNLLIAGFFGALIPMVMKALKKDPASSATIFITTATDVFGFFVFLGLATVLLN